MGFKFSIEGNIKSKIMGKANFLYTVIICGTIFAIGLSCNNSPSEIPFPFGERDYSQPVSQALKFSKESKIYWTDSVTLVKPSVKKFDFSKFSVKAFDSSGFLPFLKKPEEASFNWNKLRDTIFNYDALPSRSLKYDVSILEPPQLLNAIHPHIKNGTSDILFEFGEPFLGSRNECALADKRGFIWLASGNRLYRYDGEHLLMYSLGSINNIFNMLEDNDGKIWLGAGKLGQSLDILDFKSGTQSHIKIFEEPRGYNVGGMMLDDQQRVWVTTDDHNPKDGNPIYIIDKNKRSIKQLSKKQGIANGNSLIQDKIGNIWISTFGEGLNIINLKAGEIKYLQKRDGLSTDALPVLQLDNMNRVLAASFNGGELNIVDMQHGTIKIYDKRQGFVFENNIHIGNLLEDNSGNVWIGTWGTGEDEGLGLEVIDPERSLFKSINTVNGLSGNQIEGLLQDKRGQIWVSTNKGLNIIRRNGDNPKHTGYDNITTLAEDSRGNVWVGIVNSGVKILDTMTGLARSFNESNGLSSNNIQNINSFNGNLYIESYGGLDIIDSAFKTIEHIGKAQGLIGDSISHAFRDKAGRTWIIGSRTVGLNVMDRQKEIIFHLGNVQGIKDSVIDNIAQDSHDRIWFSNPVKGIGVIDLKVNTIKYLDNIAGLKMPGNKVMIRDLLGNMWVGTQNGIYIVNAASDSITSITEREGLFGNYVISLNEYGQCMYAGTRDGGINIIIPPAFSLNKKWEIESFGKTQGIYKKVIGIRESDIITRDGRFLWGDKGITILRKPGLEMDAPKTYISEIDLQNKPLSFTNRSWPDINADTIWSSKRDTFYLKNNLSGNKSYQDQQNIRWDNISGPYNMPANLEFPYDENYLQFHFTQANLGNHDTTWYSYILIGVDKKWSDKTDISFSQNYLNLLPGKYIFRVSSLSNGKWCEPVIFNFTIRPPWWKTWWAYLSYILICFVTIWSIVRYRSRWLIEDNKRLEKIVAQRTNELKLSMERLQSTQKQLIQSEKMASLGELTAGIAHEIQNPLNFMNNFSEVNKELIEEMKQELAEGNISEATVIANNIQQNEDKINHHGRRADAIVKGMLQHSQSSAGKKEPTDINALTDEYLRLAYHGYRAKEKSFNVMMKTNYDESIGKINIISQDMGRVLLNLYNNAFYAVLDKKKQSPEKYEPTVSVSTKKINGKVEIRVMDNGNGIPQKVIDKIFQPFFTTKPTGQGTGLGLSLSYDVIKAHGGELKVETNEGDGAEFVVLIPAI